MRFILSFFIFSALGLSSGSSKTLDGNVSIDGSSTVFPISEAIAEEARYNEDLRKIRVGVSLSGTGGGFKKFCNKEVDITGASRPIKPIEFERCKNSGVSFIELPVAWDGIVAVVHPSNTCAQNMTTNELKEIWEPAAEGKITNWKQVKENCPDLPLKLYGPGVDSGTFDYFTKVIGGESGKSRPDFVKSEDDNVLVRGVSGDKGALGYFGYAYYVENKDRVKAISINGAFPSIQSISDGSYSPLARPIFIYVSENSAKRPEVKRFVEFYIDRAAAMAKAVGYVPLGETHEQNLKLYDLVKSRFLNNITGTAFSDRADSYKSLEGRLRTKS